MRFVVYGAGAIGGVIGARLVEAGEDVVLIARGAHAEAMRTHGLTVDSPLGSRVVPVVVAEGPQGVVGAGDVVLLAVKSQDTPGALEALRDAAPPSTPVVCLQNGVENERAALRVFANVYGACVLCPANHLEPGVVQEFSAPVPGMLDLGRYPSGMDGVSARVADAFRSTTFKSIDRPDIMRWKYRKLLMNLANAVEATCEPSSRSEIARLAEDEGEACLRAAGIAVVSPEEDLARRGNVLDMQRVGGQRRGGGSTWQSLQRATGSVESDYLNGEIVLLGRQHGVATPVNALLQRLVRDMARRGSGPTAMSSESFLALLADEPALSPPILSPPGLS